MCKEICYESKDYVEINNTRPITVEVNFQEYQDLNKKLAEAEKNLHDKIEIIAALETLIATKGTDSMKNDMVKLLAEVMKREG